MLINLSNHPSNQWTENQLKAAIKNYKSVYDLAFPQISPRANSKQVQAKAKKYFQTVIKILSSSTDKSNAVHLMGEFTFVFQLANMLKKRKIPVVVSTTIRNANKNGSFNFVKFRQY